VEVELVVRNGALEGRVFPLNEGVTLTVGRGARCDIHLDAKEVSRRHCRVERRGDRVTLSDLGAANGTLVNARRVDSVELQPGDVVRVGTIELEYRALQTSPAPQPSLAITGEDPLGQTLVRRQVDPTSFTWGAPDVAKEQLELLRRVARHLATVHEVSAQLSRAVDVEALFESIVATILKVTSGDRAALLLRRPDQGDAVELVAARTREGVGQDVRFNVSRTVVNDVLEHGMSTFLRDAATDARYGSGESVILQRIHSVMCVPLRTADAILGAIYVDSRSAADRFTEADLELLAAIGNQAGIALHRARLLGDLERLFLETIGAIAATIDAKDGYTHRHSERVSAFAQRLAEAVGMTAEERRVVELASLLHDVGKIGVPDRILNKPGPLTPEELTEIRQHPAKGARILANIRSAEVQALIPGVRYHHEHWDGTGYPDGLAGEQIPLLGRVLAVADFLDALTSARPYRGPLTLEKAISLLNDGAGTHFDPALVRAAVELYARGELAPPETPLPAFV